MQKIQGETGKFSPLDFGPFRALQQVWQFFPFVSIISTLSIFFHHAHCVCYVYPTNRSILLGGSWHSQPPTPNTHNCSSKPLIEILDKHQCEIPPWILVSTGLRTRSEDKYEGKNKWSVVSQNGEWTLRCDSGIHTMIKLTAWPDSVGGLCTRSMKERTNDPWFHNIAFNTAYNNI